jgi:hypothetical protein
MLILFSKSFPFSSASRFYPTERGKRIFSF